LLATLSFVSSSADASPLLSDDDMTISKAVRY
jgi:hypothetical protein